jgi:hypothetical protein
VAVLAVTAAGCGRAGRHEQPVAGEQQWRANAAVIVRQLQVDLAAAQVAGSTVESAQEALHDESSLYGLLVSYSDFAGCREMVDGAGPLPRNAVEVDRALVGGCRHLERASALFTQAVKENDGARLLAAQRESGRALPALIRAAAALKGRR